MRNFCSFSDSSLLEVNVLTVLNMVTPTGTPMVEIAVKGKEYEDKTFLPKFQKKCYGASPTAIKETPVAVTPTFLSKHDF